MGACFVWKIPAQRSKLVARKKNSAFVSPATMFHSVIFHSSFNRNFRVIGIGGDCNLILSVEADCHLRRSTLLNMVNGGCWMVDTAISLG